MLVRKTGGALTVAQAALLDVLAETVGDDGQWTFDNLVAGNHATYYRAGGLDAWEPVLGSLRNVGPGLFVGDGTNWRGAAFSSPKCVAVSAFGADQDENGDLLEEGWELAKSLGTSTDFCDLIILPGRYRAAMTITSTTYANVWGFGNALLVPAGTTGVFWYNGAGAASLRGLRFALDGTRPAIKMQGPCAGFTHENLTIECAHSSDRSIEVADGAVLSNFVMRNVHTNGAKLYGGNDDTLTITFASTGLIERCSGGDYSWAGIYLEGGDDYGGQILCPVRHCWYKGTVPCHTFGATGKLEFCTWDGPIGGVKTGAKFRYSTIHGRGGDAIYDTDAAAVTIGASKCILISTGDGLGATVTNAGGDNTVNVNA